MNLALEDVRLLKLAEMYEQTYERFVMDVASRVIRDSALRDQVLRLVSPGDQQRERIAAQLERLRASIPPEDRSGLIRAALLDVRDVQQAARDFYLAHADRVHDPEVARLFRELAREEGTHVNIAEENLRLAERLAQDARERGRSDDGSRYEDSDSGFEDGAPLREGVSDYGRHVARAHPGGSL